MIIIDLIIYLLIFLENIKLTGDNLPIRLSNLFTYLYSGIFCSTGAD